MQWLHDHRRSRVLIWVSCVVWVAGCQPDGDVRPATVPTTSLVSPSVGVGASPTSRPTSAWRAIYPGVEWRTLLVPPGTVRILRLDPVLVRLRVAYAPNAPKQIREWMETLQPLAVVNGAYFESTNEASALTITDGTVTGQSYDGFGGMLAVNKQDQITLRSLVDQPYTPDEQVVQAIQSFPRLVWDAQALPLPHDNGQRARRTVVATDTNGQLLLIVTDTPQWTLSELARWFQHSDLQIMHALNLDGGPSTRLAVSTPVVSELLDSETPLPQVLVIDAR